MKVDVLNGDALKRFCEQTKLVAKINVTSNLDISFNSDARKGLKAQYLMLRCQHCFVVISLDFGSREQIGSEHKVTQVFRIIRIHLIPHICLALPRAHTFKAVMNSRDSMPVGCS